MGKDRRLPDADDIRRFLESLVEYVKNSPQMISNLASDAKMHYENETALPAFINFINTPQRKADAKRRQRYMRTASDEILPAELPIYFDRRNTPLGDEYIKLPNGRVIKKPKLNQVGNNSVMLPSGKVINTPPKPKTRPKTYFDMPGYMADTDIQEHFRNEYLKSKWLQSKNLQDAQYFLANLATDPRSIWAQSAIRWGLGTYAIPKAAVAAAPYVLPLLGIPYKNLSEDSSKKSYDVGANEPGYIQYIRYNRPQSYQTQGPYVYQSMDTNYLNRPSKQPYRNINEAIKQYENALYGKYNSGGVLKDTLNEMAIKYYTDIYSKAGKPRNELTPIAHEAYRFAEPLIQQNSNINFKNAIAELNNQRFANYLNEKTNEYRKNVLQGRSDNLLSRAEKEKLAGVQSMLRQNYIEQYNKDKYLEDLSNVLSSQFTPSMAAILNETWKQRLNKPMREKMRNEQEKYLPEDKQNELNEAKNKWYRTAPVISNVVNAVVPFDESQYDQYKVPYFMPESEFDRRVLSRAGTSGLTTERFTHNLTPQYFKEKIKQSTTQKRMSKKQPNNVIQKSLSPKYNTIVKNKYLKEK